MSLSGRTGRARLALPALAALVPWALLAWRFDFLTDDAFISFRYARNLAEGVGLRFNPGTEPPVEGYSNLLWVLWLALGESLGMTPTVVARVTGLLCGAVLVLLFARFALRRADGDPLRAALPALFLGTLPPLAVWSTGGLATMAFTLCVFGAYERLFLDPQRPRGLQAGLWASAALLLRADGFVWVGALLVASAAWAARAGDRRLARALATAGALAAATLAANFLWRRGYHGAWLPNTARAKVGLSALTLERGAKYVGGFLLTFLSVPAALFASAAGLARPRDGAAPVALAVVVATLLYGVLSGGDFMAFGRFLVPGLPFLALGFACALARLGSTASAVPFVTALVVLSLLPAFDVHPAPRAWREALHFRWNADVHVTEVEQWRAMNLRRQRWTVVGKALEQHTEPGDSLCATVIGAIGYYSRRVVYDQYGLTEPAVLEAVPGRNRRSAGHDRGVAAEFFLDREPTFLLADLVSERARFQAFPQRWRDDPESLQHLRVEFVPLASRYADPPGEFDCPPGTLLRLVRLVP